MLLRALAATSAEGWEEEAEKLSQIDRIRTVNVDEIDAPLKQQQQPAPAALPSTFGSFLAARRVASSDARGRGERKDQ
jgi:hypothetical protein